MYGNVTFSILVLSTKKRYSSFLKKILVFQKLHFKVKVLKTFKFPVIVTENYANLSNEGLFLKSLVSFFRRTYGLSVGFKMKPLRQSVFLC